MTVAEFISKINQIMPNDINESIIVHWINLLEDEIYTRHATDEIKPEPKTLEGIGTEELSLMSLGYRWYVLYEYYILGKICVYREEYGKANNYNALYNANMDDFIMWYYPNRSNPVRDARMTNFR